MFAGGAVDDAVNAPALRQVEEHRLLQQAIQAHGRRQADHFDVESVRLVEGFKAIELQHLQAQIAVQQGQGEGTFLVVMHRTRFCQGVRAQRVRNRGSLWSPQSDVSESPYNSR